MLRFTDSRFKSSHEITIGLEFGSKSIKIQKQFIKLQIWDTAGQENFRSIARSYYRGAVGIILMYDITSKDSFFNTLRWLNEIKEVACPNIVISLVGNKVDLKEKRKVQTAEGKDFASNNGLFFFETSALSGENVEKVFTESCECVLNRVRSGEIDTSQENSGVKILKKEKKKKNCC
jgi:Ras-related protein Rab-2A